MLRTQSRRKRKKAEQEEVKEQEKKEEEGKEEDKVLEEEQEEVILRRFDVGFNKWLSGLSEVELEKVVSRLMKGHANEKTTMEYIECVKSMEHMVRFCSKCRRTGCEECDYVKCLRCVVGGGRSQVIGGRGAVRVL